MRTKSSFRLATAIASCLCAGPAPGQEFLVVGEKVSGSIGFYVPDGKRITSVPVGKHPHELALSPDGRLAYSTDNGILWMTDAGEGGNTISILDIRKREKVGVIDLGKIPPAARHRRGPSQRPAGSYRREPGPPLAHRPPAENGPSRLRHQGRSPAYGPARPAG